MCVTVCRKQLQGNSKLNSTQSRTVMEQLVSRIESLEGMMRKIGVVLGSEDLSDTPLTAERETGDNVSD